MDIALLVAGTDDYYLECQMKNDSTILRLRPRLKADHKHPMTKKELTEFVEEAILVLKEELSDGYLTELEYLDYVRLFCFAVDRVLAKHLQMRKEVHQMTEPLIKLPSMIVKELRTEITAQKTLVDSKDAELKSKDAEIKRLQELVYRPFLIGILNNFLGLNVHVSKTVERWVVTTQVLE